MGMGYPASRLEGIGERRKLPRRGPGHTGAESRSKRILVNFELEKTNLVMSNLIFFCHFITHLHCVSKNRARILCLNSRKCRPILIIILLPYSCCLAGHRY